MSTAGEHDDGSQMAHTVTLRDTLRSWIDWVLGQDTRKEVFVKVMPVASTVEDWPKDEHLRRDRSFGLSALILLIAGMVFLQIVGFLMNCVIARKRRAAEGRNQDKPKHVLHQQGIAYVDKSSMPAKDPARPAQQSMTNQEAPTTPRPDQPLIPRTQSDASEEPHDDQYDAETQEFNVEDIGDSDAEEELQSTQLRVVGYDSRDLYFILYHTLYCVGCLVVAGYAVLNDYMSKHFGLDYEFYILWVIYIIVLHFTCLCHVFKKAMRLTKDMPSHLTAIPKSCLPADGHLGVLRDAVTAGIYAQELFTSSGWDAVVLATITLVSTTCIFLPNVWIFKDVYPLRDFQQAYWPIIIEGERQFLQSKRQTAEPQKKGFFENLLGPVKDFWRSDNKKKKLLQKFLLFLDANTRQHKQATSLLGDLPQVICGTIFLLCYEDIKNATFVFASTAIACAKTLLVLFLRAPTLCLMASYEVQWSHLTPTDIKQGTIKFWLVKWILQSAACRLLLRDPETTLDARIEALKSLHKLHNNSQNDDRREDLRSGEIASEEDERMEACHVVLWEVAQQNDPRIQKCAKEFLEAAERRAADSQRGQQPQVNRDQTDWKKAAMQLRRLTNEVPMEKIEAMKLLIKDYPQFSPAYAKVLQEDLSKRMSKPPGRTPQDAQALPIMIDCPCVCCLSGIVAAGQDCWDELCCCCPAGCKVEGEVCQDEKAEELDKQNFVKEWRDLRDVRFAAAKALADLATMSKKREGEKQKKFMEELTEHQRSMALRAIKSVAQAVVERLDSNIVEISSAALVVAVAFRSQEEIELAVKKAVDMLKGETSGTKAIKQLKRGGGLTLEARAWDSLREEKRRTAEILLVQLLPEVDLEPKKPEGPAKGQELKGQEYWLNEVIRCGFEHGSTSSDRTSPSSPARYGKDATARRVLERLGGRTARLARKQLETRSDLDLDGKELLKVLKTQDQDLKNMNEEWRLGRTMNLMLGLEDEKASAVSREDLNQIAQGKEIFEVLVSKNLAFHLDSQPDCKKLEDGNPTHVLPVFFTDLEPDDTMFIAEMWRLLRIEEASARSDRLKCCEPMVIFATDLVDKDAGLIFAKKLMLAALVLGKLDYRILTPRPDARNTKQSPSAEKGKEKKEVNQKMKDKLDKLRDKNMEAIQKRLRSFKGKVDFFVCAPGRGNLGEIVHGDETKTKKPHKEFMEELLEGKTFSVALYSGQFNVKSMEEDDLEGFLSLLDDHSSKKEAADKKKEQKGKSQALMDVSKFPFFGGEEAHPATGGLSTFALASFAPTMKCKYPEVALLWSLFNDEFNRSLISPEKIFKVAEVGERMEKLRGLYKDGKTVEYASTIIREDDLFRKVEPKKKLTLKNFAYGCCDAPLCDQLIFVERWAAVYQQFLQLWPDQQHADWEPAWVRSVKGKWHFDKRAQHTNVDPLATHTAPDGVQPTIQFPCNMMAIYRMSEALQEYTLGQLDDLRKPKYKLTQDEATRVKLFSFDPWLG